MANMSQTTVSDEPLHVIVNPVAGHGTASAFITEHVLPRLAEQGVAYEVHVTTGVQDAGRIGKRLSQAGVRRVAIAGGDGTTHEFIEGVSNGVLTSWELIIFPLGTANALYSSLHPHADLASVQGKQHSLQAFLDGKTPKSIPVTQTKIGELPPIYSHVVSSFALHAAIVEDSEKLRAEHPGVERFKMAAVKNADVFYEASAKLLPAGEQDVRQYDPITQTFIAAGPDISGPFAYFLATSSTPRLEPTFVIAPLLELQPADKPSMDIVIIRPLRDAAIAQLTPGQRGAKWSERAWDVLGWAYREGGHIDLTYPVSGSQLETRGNGLVVVEYFRCGGFEWSPQSSKASSFCADGAMHHVPTGQKASAELSEVKFAVWT